jgi:response regulator RpfG family c-di-GMP phosphodiesterase
MAKTVLDVGNCGPDHRAIKEMLTRNFAAQVIQAHAAEDTLEYLRSSPVDLVLINRKLDQDYSDGIEILKLIKQDPALSATPVMLVTNHEHYQSEAVQLGALEGFGKLALNSEVTRARLATVLL